MMTKEAVKALIQEYADNCGNATIIGTLGTGGTSWQGDAEQGLLSVCDGIADSISNEMQLRHQYDFNILNSAINGTIRGQLNIFIGILKDQGIFPPTYPPIGPINIDIGG